MNRTNLPFVTADEIILNEAYHRLVTISKLPRPSKFVDQTISFCESFCGNLLSHEIVKSSLVRGLSCFDSAGTLHGTEEQYTVAVESLTGHFVSVGWITSSEKLKLSASIAHLSRNLEPVVFLSQKTGFSFWFRTMSYSANPSCISYSNVHLLWFEFPNRLSFQFQN